MNSLRTDRNVALESTRKELNRIKQRLDGLYDAIADGLRTQGLKTKLEEYEQRKITLEKLLSNAPPPAPILHPKLAELYRQKVEDLQTSLNADDTRTKAAEILRGLIECVRVRYTHDGLEVELIGEIVNMVDLAQSGARNGKAASNETAIPSSYRSSVKVVAGAGFEPATFRL